MTHKIKGKKVTVVGMGKSGLSAAALLAKEGAEVLIVDDNALKAPLPLASGIQFKHGGWNEADLMDAEFVVLSPGVPRSKLPIEVLEKAGIPLISEIELAASRISAPIIAITGTNGKSTTTTLVGQILKNWGLNVFVGGNLGLPLSEAVNTDWDFVVAELSSFQLESMQAFRPRIAALLNITPDHLNRYDSFQNYQETKWRIFENQHPDDHAIFNRDDPLTLPPTYSADAVYFSKNHALDRGVYLQDGIIKSTIWGDAEDICRLEDIKGGAGHHIENALAACAITQLCGCANKGITQSLRTFKGLPHRMEFIRTHAGVHYVNDSKGTNVGALKQSLESMPKAVILIAGGRDKAADFSTLQKVIQKKVKHLFLIGEARHKMAACFSDHPALETIDSSDGMKAMEIALSRAAATARSGETVLLSPGCASFDMFQSYEARGNGFKTLVEALP
ncbi:UDP-N-acetylmuramoylalanine--D-glutamate ligase [hydrothermal vent metagenome]|uniref:UDP-N-acetylmuramoylalanine--D-glutamate ligase n=1 Tax=hydrothermal vent metagenome TaxID=652676 RepID=A0A3B1CD66_9ZZZZ